MVEAVVARQVVAHPNYSSAERQQILEAVHQVPDWAADGTVTWSLYALQRHLCRQGLPHNQHLHDPGAQPGFGAHICLDGNAGTR